jgi:trehalose 6-phosphate phosphatase
MTLMQLIDPSADVDRFFSRVDRAGSSALLLDYDGTLAPFRTERDRAFPYPGAQEALREIAGLGNTRLVIISGRPAEEVSKLLRLEQRPEIWGNHGWERLLPNGSHRRIEPPEWAQQALDRGVLLALSWGRLRGIGAFDRQVERKLASLALHWRGCASPLAAEIRYGVGQEWEALAQYSGLELRDFEQGMELRVPGRTKGDAVETIVQEMGKNAVLAYLGDDLTDEDAFRAMKGKGLSVLVRSELRPSAADLWIRPPRGLLQFLWLWEDLHRYPSASSNVHKRHPAVC